jgi:hypothetical protein
MFSVMDRTLGCGVARSASRFGSCLERMEAILGRPRLLQVSRSESFYETLSATSASKFADPGSRSDRNGNAAASRTGIRSMLSKCANPSCSTQLIYLREGKIFVMDAAAKAATRPAGPSLVKATERTEHFWLCGPCSAHLTMVYHPERGPQVKPKRPFSGRAAAS